MPALVLLARRAYEQRSRALETVVVSLAFIGYAYLPQIGESHFSSTHGLASLTTTDPYPLVGMLILAVCAASLARARLRQPRLPAGVRHAVRPRANISSRDLIRGLR